MSFDREQEKALGRAVLGRPYKLGAKWLISSAEPLGPIDCSGFSRWYVYRCRGVIIPEGSYNQIKVCTRLSEDKQKTPPPMSLGFYAHDGKDVDHVVVVFDEENVIEARGVPYEEVIFRPISKWVAQEGFLGFYQIPYPEANA